jgi:hypothetical protein
MGKNVFGEKCAITGAPARYRDPVSGLPYADLAAFKIIKERYHSVEGDGAGPAAPNKSTDAAAAELPQPAPTPNALDSVVDQAKETVLGVAEGPTAGAAPGEGGVVVTAAQLEAMSSDPRVRAALQDDRLRQLVRDVDNAPDRLKALLAAREDPQMASLMGLILVATGEADEVP